MRAEQSIESNHRDVWKVSAWKWGIDQGSPRWRQLYFKWIYLPFLSFSHKIGIPAPKEVVVESDTQGNTRRIFRWFEDEGIFEHEDQANAGCLDEHWGYCKLPYGRLMQLDSASYSGTIFPRKKQGAQKWAKPKFPFLIKDRKQEEREQQTLAASLARLNEILDRR